jgi:catalase
MLIDDCTVDFEQPRALWTKVFDDTAKEHYIKNVAGHLGNVKSSEVKNRQRMFRLLDASVRPISHEMSRSGCLRCC